MKLLLLAIAVAVACDRAGPGVIPERVSCPSCRIDVQRVAVIGDTVDYNMLNGRPERVFIDSRGRYWIDVLDAFPQVYIPARDRLEPFGEAGGGPGEYRRPWFRALLTGDSILLNDYDMRIIGPDRVQRRKLRRVPYLESVAVVQWPHNLFCMLEPPDDRMRASHTVVSTCDFSGDSVIFGATMFDLLTHGASAVEYANNLRVMGRPSATGEIWVSNWNAYRLVRYSSDGRLQDSVLRQPRWFPAGKPMRIGEPGKPSTPRLIGNWVDSNGYLWILAAKPRRDTRQAWEGKSIPKGEVRLASLPAQYKLYQTMVEVIDLTSRRVITRHTFDGYIVSILPDQQVASFVETESGIPILHIDRLSLRRK